MYDIKQFRPSLYLLVMLGITGFCIAALEPVLWVLAIGCILFNAYLVRRGRFRPIPQWLSNLITLLSLAFVSYQIVLVGTTAALMVGEFLVFLQIVKLFEQRVNRDYGQVLILSLLLMVAAMISTASLLFGILLIVYLFLGLYTCVLFHLKVEADRARAAQTLPPEKISPAALRQDQVHFARSMRRVTGLLSAISVFVAVVVFIGFPRGSGSGVFGQIVLRSPDELSGFSERMTYDQLNKITQDDSIIAYVKVSRNGNPVEGGAALFLRGMTLDRYTKQGPGRAWQWVHSGARPAARVVHVDQVQSMEVWHENTPATDAGARTSPEASNDMLKMLKQRWVQEIHLFPTGTRALFGLAGIEQFRPSQHDIHLRIDRSDGTLQTAEMPITPLDYTLISTNDSQNLPVSIPLTQDDKSGGGRPPADLSGASVAAESSNGPAALPQNAQDSDQQSWDIYRAGIDPAILKYARDIAGPLQDRLPAHRDLYDPPSKVDQQIAQAIATHLQTHFKYTLDFRTDHPRADVDPLVSFLTQWKRGHCEYFAGAMVLMCQSLGMHARVVIGFRTDEYNSLLNEFTVRGSHAHAWVEVLTPHGWVTFDPTSSNMADAQLHSSATQAIRHFFNYLEYQWASAVVGYDNESRNNLMIDVQRRLTNTIYRSSDGLNGLRQWWDQLLSKLDDVNVLSFWPKALTALVGILIVVLVAIVSGFTLNRWRIHRRAKTMGLGALPSGERLRLARQLGFYEEMTKLLQRQKIIRPPHLTPREFSASLSYLPADAYTSICRLTEVFYRIRYGGSHLGGSQQRRLHSLVERLAQRLATDAS